MKLAWIWPASSPKIASFQLRVQCTHFYEPIRDFFSIAVASMIHFELFYVISEQYCTFEYFIYTINKYYTLRDWRKHLHHKYYVKIFSYLILNCSMICFLLLKSLYNFSRKHGSL